jgi:Bardet-Biedl syndrome 2 protein
MNSSLVAEYSARASNHQQLLDALKDVSAMIQKAAKLRVGAAKTAVVAACRDAVRANDLKKLAAIIRTGNAK